MDLIPQREYFIGPERLSPAWTLTKDRKTATCEVWSHEFGFELRLTVATELLQSEVCRTQEDLVAVQERWRAGLEVKWVRVVDDDDDDHGHDHK